MCRYSDGHLRVKEVFESIEAYKVLCNFVIASQRTYADMTSMPSLQQSNDNDLHSPILADIDNINNIEDLTANVVETPMNCLSTSPIICDLPIQDNNSVSGIKESGNGILLPVRGVESIVELACGHGLVGVLLAYRFPYLQVHLYDLFKRPTYDAFIRAFEEVGLKRPGEDKVLPNIVFHEEDLLHSKEYIPSSIVVCLHGCGDANKNAIEMAIDHGAAGWAVMPCCILKDGSYLGEQSHVKLSDNVSRHPFMCGALASRYGAQLVDSIDNRITDRHIVIAGGVGGGADRSPSTLENVVDKTKVDSSESRLRQDIRRGRLPKLRLS